MHHLAHPIGWGRGNRRAPDSCPHLGAWGLLLVFGMLASPGLWAQVPGDDASPPSESSLSVRIIAEGPEGEVPLGTPFEVRYRLEYPQGFKIFFPDRPTVAPLVLVQANHQVSPVLGVTGSEEHLLRLMAVRKGTVRVPSLEVPFVAPSGEAGIARTPEVSVQVASVIADTQAPELAPAGQPVPVRVPNLPLLIGIGAVATALLAGVLAIWGWRRYQAWKEAHRPPPPPRPAHEVALERLQALEAQGLVEAQRFQELALGVSEILREYLGAIHGFQGVDLTTWEVLRALERKDLGRLTSLELEEFLSFCDLVKFAKYQPAPEEAGAMIPRARDIVIRGMEGRRSAGEADRPKEG